MLDLIHCRKRAMFKQAKRSSGSRAKREQTSIHNKHRTVNGVQRNVVLMNRPL
jgi:hypothetical protein